MNEKNLQKHEYFINRELSWLEFNNRVLQEARDHDNPLFERVKFLSIVSSNLDEFFMVRYASLKDQVNAGFNKHDPAGLNPVQQLDMIAHRTHSMLEEQYNCFNRALIPALRKQGIHFLDENELTITQKKFISDYFNKFVFPVLTPMAVDPSRPFPLILNKSLNLGVIVKEKGSKKKKYFATVQVPAVLPRFVELSNSTDGERNFMLLEEIIAMHMGNLFSGHDVLAVSPYRIIRNADLSIEEDEAEDLLKEIEKSLKKRKWGEVIRLEIDHNPHPKLLAILKAEHELKNEDIYLVTGPIDLTFLMKFYGLKGYESLKYGEFVQRTPLDLLGEEDIFEAIKKKDILLCHPYESFAPVVDFINQAAMDPNVLAIKQTLYRVSGDSPIIKALAEAAERGKQVTVLLEVKARFDEERNIHWAKSLEQSGCHVIYGLVGLKTHCKIALVVRREDGGIKRYVHFGTGNYNDITAKLYTDIGVFSSNEYLCADASAVFNMLSGFSQPQTWYKVEVAPLGLRRKILELINTEIENAKSGKKAKIIAKMNSLVDKEIIMALYKASAAGVTIELIVRGICCLRPGVKRVSENIIVRSIIGRFLEHSRIYYFYNDGREVIYLSSADIMPRNLDRRVELLIPIEDNNLKERLINSIHIGLHDTAKAWILNKEGSYKRVDRRGKKYLDSQLYFSGPDSTSAVYVSRNEAAASSVNKE